MQAHEHRLIDIITPLIEPLGYEVVHVEIQTHRQKTLRLYIDFTSIPQADESGKIRAIGIEDCVKVAKALDEPLDQCAELETMFKGGYELEVSSPGVDRPLRQKKDYERFAGRQVRLHTFRALSSDEIGNAPYFEKNPKQKNFLGVLKGLTGDSVRLAVGESDNSGHKKKAKAQANNSGMEIKIPLLLISKANLLGDVTLPND